LVNALKLAAVWMLLGLALTACGHTAVEDVETEAAPIVETMTLVPRTVDATVSATGLVAAAPGADWTITAPEPARILDMPKAEGDRVAPGDLLVRFEIPSLSTDLAQREAEVRQAQAHVANAQASVNRLTTLVQHGVAAQKDLEDAQRDLSEAQATLAQSQRARENASVLASRTVVRARFAGVVARRAHNPGDMVDASASDVILRIIDPSRLQVVASVPIADLARVRTGQAVQITVPGAEGPLSGKVLTRPAAVDPAGVAADVRIAFDHEASLPAGTPVRVDIVTDEHPNALAVPTEAVLHEDEGTFVMLAGADNKAHKTTVTTGLATAKQIEITRGLKAGDAVIVQGQQGLPDGGAIRIAK
jgi:RND family efflux transporter MFP subunit